MRYHIIEQENKGLGAARNAAIAAAFVDCGAKTRKGDVGFLAANAIMSYDLRVDPATLARFGIKDD